MPRSPYALVLSLLLMLTVAGPSYAAGVLVPRDGSAPIRVRSQRVSAAVENGIARTTVRQTFVNPHGRALEAIYTFPVPDGAALVDVAMEVGGQRLEGLVVERKKARQIYDSIVRRKKDPALVEQIGRNTFRLSVFPVLPGQPTVVELTWIEPVRVEGGRLRYVYPLALAGVAASVEQDLTVTVHMRSAVPLADVTSPNGAMSIRRSSKTEVLGSLEVSGAKLDRDVVLEARVTSTEPSLAVRTYRGASGAGFFAAVVTPPDANPDDALPRDVTLVLDTSGSMKGDKLYWAQQAALHVLDSLRPGDRVNLLRFESAVEPFAEEPVPVTEENLARLTAFVNGLEAKGGTALGDAIAAATRHVSAAGRVGTVVLLTDGLPTVGEQNAAKIVAMAAAARGRGLRVYSFGVGDDVDRTLLEGVARASGGKAEVFRDGSEIVMRVDRFLRRTSTPLLAGAVLEVEGLVNFDQHPNPIPVLHLGEQMVLTGRFKGSGEADVTLTAHVAGKPITLRTRATFPGEPAGSLAVRDLYARQKLDDLEQVLRLRSGLNDQAFFASIDQGRYSTEDEIVRAVIDLSMETGIQSAYTSFLVLLPEDKARLDPRDLKSLETALQRVRERRGELAGIDPAKAPSSDSPTMPEELEATENMTIGIGGGAGGGFGPPRGGHRSLRAGGGGKKTENAVDWALEWLRKHQHPDGRWDPSAHPDLGNVDRCAATGDAALTAAATGAALLSFLGAGETHMSGRHKDAVKRGLKYLKSIQNNEGCFGPPKLPDARINHALAAAAVIEAYGLTGSRLFKQPAQRATDYIVRSMRPVLSGPDADPDVEAWLILALRSAQQAKIDVDLSFLTEALRRIDAAESKAPAGEVRAFATVRLLARVCTADDVGNVVRHEAEIAALGLADIARDPGVPAPDIHRAFHETIVAFQIGGDTWKRCNAALKTAVIERQKTESGRCERGSWEPEGAWGKRGGRVLATALRDLCTGIYYRYGRIIGSR